MRSGSSEYGGIDWMKLAAALLVVAIHTGPLLSYNREVDQLLTGILARVAVPLFFMASGFLFFRKLLGDPQKDRSRLLRYVTKTMRLYAIAILMYVPLNLYRGDFEGGISYPALIRDILVDGTFYHLWYLPALATGLALVYFLHRWVAWRWVLIMAGLLYGAGLLGDSYYGLTLRLGMLDGLYDWLFQWMAYTRNGLFFAPVFLAIGAWLSRRPPRIKRKQTYAFLLLLSLAALVAEGRLLHAAGYPRHDSMYISLLPSVTLIFILALQYRGGNGGLARQLSQWMYIVHPLAIVLVRGAAKPLGWETLLIGQSLIHYAAVSALSALLSLAIVTVASRYTQKRQNV